MAGGQGTRLHPLTRDRAKPAVPFGGKYRIIDFVLSNLVNSGIYAIYILVQWRSQSLIEHLKDGWQFGGMLPDHFVIPVPAQMRLGETWYQGTADAIFQNLNLMDDFQPDLVAVFGADHIYRMDIRQMIDFHLEKGADVTVAARPVPLDQASAFGVIATDREHRITGFQEKPAHPVPMPDVPDRAYVSMGNYIFNRDILVKMLVHAQKKGQHDFGKHIIPGLVGSGKVYSYDFATNGVPGTRPCEEPGYWRDVGTISAYFRAHMDMLGELPVFDLNNKRWPIYPAMHKEPAAQILSGVIRNSILSEGVTVQNATIVNSVIRRDVVIQDGTAVEDCIIMDHTVIGKGCRLKGVIIDKYNTLPQGIVVDADSGKDVMDGRLCIDPSGIRIIPKPEIMIG